MKNKLVNALGNEIPARPNICIQRHAYKIITLAVESMFSSRSCPFSGDEKDKVLSSAIDGWCDIQDAYELAKRFEMSGWHGSVELVNNLDELVSYIDFSINDVEKEWFDLNKPVPPFEIGHEIKTYRGLSGKISGISKNRAATYEVQTEDSDTSRYLIRFEDAESAELSGK